MKTIVISFVSSLLLIVATVSMAQADAVAAARKLVAQINGDFKPDGTVQSLHADVVDEKHVAVTATLVGQIPKDFEETQQPKAAAQFCDSDFMRAFGGILSYTYNNAAGKRVVDFTVGGASCAVARFSKAFDRLQESTKK